MTRLCEGDVSVAELSFMMMASEANNYRKYILPKLIGAAWDNEPHLDRRSTTSQLKDRISLCEKTHRRSRKRADFLLRSTYYFPFAVIESQVCI